MHRTDKVESTLRELNLHADDKYATTVNTHVIFTDRCNKTHKSCAQETTHAVRRQRNALFPVLPNDLLRVSQDGKNLAWSWTWHNWRFYATHTKAFTPRLKNATISSCYNFDIHKSSLITFGRHITEQVSNQKKLYFPTHLTNQSSDIFFWDKPYLCRFFMF